MDLRPLRESPAFRRLWAGSSLSAIGSQMTSFAVVVQVYTLTHSSLAVGAIGLAIAVPLVGFGLVGGAVADAVDRRTLVLLSSASQAGVSVAFAVQAFAGLRQLWLLYCLIVAQSLLSAVSGPARRTFLPRLLRADRVPAAAALTMFTFHLSVTVGPALAGVIVTAWGVRACYLIDVVTFAAALYGVARLPAMSPEDGPVRPGVRAIGAALRFIRGDRVIAGALLSDLSATLLGMPMALFPAINAAHFGGGAHTLGLLTAAPAVGGIVGTVLSGPVGTVSRQGRAILVAGAVWGASLAGFGLARSLWLALVLLAVAGAVDVLSVVFRTTVVQVTTPDRYRGRVAAAELIVGMGFPQLGNFRAGVVGALTSPTISAVSGGLTAILGVVLIGLTMPAFARYQSPPGVDGPPGGRPGAGCGCSDHGQNPGCG
ncbi:MAG: MFS transporter [Actinobacteria bacterium]|nr:MFS transporter [Actinomycetota bacterium]